MPGLKLIENSRKFEIKSKSATKAEILLYGSIGSSMFDPDAVSAKQFSDELKKLDASVNEIVLRINSPGGDVFDGIAIYNRLLQHKAKVTVYVDGMAASIASIIALAGDEVIIGEGATYMIHLPWTGRYGNRMDFENTINRLEEIEQQMISIYVKRTGMARSEIKSMLEEETWFDPAQAIEHGFADKIAGPSMAIAASLLDKATWINKMPKALFTDKDEAKLKIENLKKEVTEFLAR